MIERYDPRAEALQIARRMTRYADQVHSAVPRQHGDTAVEGSAEAGYVGAWSAEAEPELESELMPEFVASPPASVDGAQAPRVRSRKAHWAGWGASMVAVGAVLGLVIIAGMKFVSDPVEVKAKSLPEEQAAVAPTPYKPPVSLLSALNFELAYPGEFDQVSQVKTDPKSVAQYTLSSKKNYRHMITVNLREMEPDGLGGDSNYRVRQIHPNEYKETQEHIRGDLVSVMTKSDHQEQTFFWVHGNKVLIVAATSSDARDDLAAMIEAIKKSVRWK